MFLNQATARTSTRCSRIGSPVNGKPMRTSTTTAASAWAHERNQATPSPHRSPRFLLAWKYSPLPHHRQTIYPHWAGSTWKQCPPSSSWGLSAPLRSAEGLSSCKQWGTWKRYFDSVVTSFCSLLLLKDPLLVSEDVRLVAQQWRSLHSDNQPSYPWPPHTSLWGADGAVGCFLPNLSTLISTVTFGCWNLGGLWAKERTPLLQKAAGFWEPAADSTAQAAQVFLSIKGEQPGRNHVIEFILTSIQLGMKWESQWLKNFNACSPQPLIILNHWKH